MKTEDIYLIPPCPSCAGTDTRVSVSRVQTKLTTRQHTCTACGRHWSTALPNKLPEGTPIPRHTHADACHYCAGTRVTTNGTRRTATTVERYRHCHDCGAHYRTAEYTKTKSAPKKK